MARPNNVQIANIALLNLKKDFNNNPRANKFDFLISTDEMSEQFNERVFENIICSEIKCKIEIIKRDKGIYRIKRELNKYENSNQSRFL